MLLNKYIISFIIGLVPFILQAEPLENEEILLSEPILEIIPPFTLQILHAADMKADTASLENIPRFARVLNAFKDTYPHTVILSAGNNFIAGPVLEASQEETMQALLGITGQGKANIYLMNAMGFQASALGLHDFDAGIQAFTNMIAYQAIDDNQDGQIDRRYVGTFFPYLSSNLDFSNSTLEPFVMLNAQEYTQMKNKIAKSTIIMVGNERIGVIGLTNPHIMDTPVLEKIKAFPKDKKIQTLVDLYLQPTIDDLVAQNINKIILLSNMGQYGIEADQIAPLLKDVDVIIAGGSQAIFADDNDYLRLGDVPLESYPLWRMSAIQEPIAIVSTEGNYRYLGRLVLHFNEQGIILPEELESRISGIYATDENGVDMLYGMGLEPYENPLVEILIQYLQQVLFSASE